ncbi:MAG TPA: HDOD domain-containing protein [Candidatus Acidoferrales bacterium]|jgi:EAL and modified HD-GYP domain-containing signal transduction protein|nr:HDOD domain-containing protein [Candidatus Acidoferrales bacterium]
MKYLARQPILNRARELFAYELLFRSGLQNSCDGLDLETASTSVLDTSFLIGLEKITAGHPMFINCTRDFLLRDYVCLFPPKSVVVEILETVKPDQDIVDACRRLKQAGYSIALDDFVDSPDCGPLVAIADIIKVDFRLTERKEQSAIVSRYAGRNIRMLAEKVETQEEFTAGMQMGYSLFQGYFFCHPEIMQHRALPSSKSAYLDFLRAATAPELDIRELALKIKNEPSLTFRLLRYLNSAAFGLRAEVRSVAHALSLLGERELRKWIAVVSVGVLADGKPDELMTVPLVRGRFCELLAPLAGMAGHANDLFLMGLLSVMDAILDQPLDSILAELRVRTELKDALLAQTGSYWQLLEIAIAHERADWERVSALVLRTGMNEEQVSALYVAAVDWSTDLRRMVTTPVAG